MVPGPVVNGTVGATICPITTGEYTIAQVRGLEAVTLPLREKVEPFFVFDGGVIPSRHDILRYVAVILRYVAILAQLGLNYISIGGCGGVLIAMIVFFQAIAYLGVRYIKG